MVFYFNYILCVLSCFVLFSFKCCCSLHFSGECRQLVFPQFFFVANKRLVNHTIKTVKVQDMDYCEWMCYKEPDCVSVNFEIGTRQCDLNNATHRNHGAELEDEDGFLYHGADVRAKLRIIKNISFSVFFSFFVSVPV